MIPKQTRMLMGCGWLPETLGTHPWRPGAYDRGGRRESDPVDSVCAGYLCTLPEVYSAATSMVHWERGTLEAKIGKPVTEDILEELEVLEGSRNAVESWSIKESSRG